MKKVSYLTDNFFTLGTLCETLLMVEAYKLNIICPNKDQTPHLSFTSSGHLLESETYIGGKVECLET